MTESLHITPCPICSSTLNATYDSLEGKLTLRPENLPPLAKDCLAVCALYKRLKGLGAAWEKSHGARGIVYAQGLLTAVGASGGQLERALGLLEWLAAGKKDFDLSTAPNFLGQYYAAQKEAQEAALGPKCKKCGGKAPMGRKLCDDHFFCWECREGLDGKEWSWVKGEAVCENCGGEK